MTAPGRGNGLRAETYTPLADLDPRIADVMLDLLRDSGIAAYVIPVGSEPRGQLGPRLPERPTERLYVDADATEPARQVLRSHLPSLDGTGLDGGSANAITAPPDEDDAWREIIASFDAEPTGPVPPWPASEDLDDTDGGSIGGTENIDGRHGLDDSGRRGTARGRGRTDAGTLDDRHADGTADRDNPEDHYVPPPPPPVPHPAPATALCWACLLGGPIYLLVATLLSWRIEGWAAFLAVAAFIGGFVTLVLRMGDHSPTDDGPDDGAVV